MESPTGKLREWFDELESAVNLINDADGQWWPFLFLRPPQHRRMGSLRMAALALLYGLVGGLLADLLLLSVGHSPDPWEFPLLLITVLFGAYRGIFAVCWNRRATRLIRIAENSERWGVR